MPPLPTSSRISYDPSLVPIICWSGHGERRILGRRRRCVWRGNYIAYCGIITFELNSGGNRPRPGPGFHRIFRRGIDVRRTYLLLAALGFLLPYAFLISFLLEFGFDLPLLIRQLFASDISTFFAVDLIIATIVFWIFLYRESRRLNVRYWGLYVLATLLVGLSFALPLFLYAREPQLERVS